MPTAWMSKFPNQAAVQVSHTRTPAFCFIKTWTLELTAMKSDGVKGHMPII